MAVSLRKCMSMRERGVYIRLATDTLLRCHLRSKGYDVDPECRICNRGEESIQHFLKNHVSHDPNLGIPLAPAFKRKMAKIEKIEAEQMSVKAKRIKLNIDVGVINFITPMFDLAIFSSQSRLKFRKKCYPSKRSTVRPRKRRQK